MIPKSKRLVTERLILRIVSAADFPHIFSAAHVPGFTDGMQWSPPKSLEELEAPLKRGLLAWEKQEAFSFTLEDRETHRFIGRISIRPGEGENVWNIGFWTHPNQQSQGYMAEAVAAILQFGFEELVAQQITAAHALWNTASEKVLQRNGMTLIKYIEQGFQKNGVWVAENMLGISKEEWVGRYHPEFSAKT